MSKLYRKVIKFDIFIKNKKGIIKYSPWFVNFDSAVKFKFPKFENKRFVRIFIEITDKKYII